jgi:hypothetical protein
MTEIFVCFSRLPGDYFRDDIDDALRGLLKGKGRLSGGGIALDGSGVNFDLVLFSNVKNEVDHFLDLLLQYLRSLPAPAGTQVVVAGEEGESHIPV